MRWLGRVAAERPIVVALEDLHVADAATRAFATFVSRIAREERLSLVLTWQPDRLTREHPLRANLAVIEAGLRAPVRVDLAPLTRREIGNQIEGIEGERPSASVVVLVAERSAGTPLVIEELIAARRELKHVSLTGTLGDLIAARLARRSHECRRVLRLLAPSQRPMERDRLAVVSAAFEAELATAMVASNLPPRSSSMPRRAADGLDADLAAGLAEAIEHGFVREEPDGRLRIRHELVARAVVTDLLPTQRPRYRAALATAFGDIPIVAAHHWRAAYRPAEARAAALEAGRLALELEAPLDALDAFELGLELPLPPPVAGPRRRAAERVAGRRRAGRGLAAGGRGGGRGRPPQPRDGLRGERPRGPRGAAGPLPARRPRGAARPLPARGGRRAGRDRGAAQGRRRDAPGAVDRAGPRPRAARPGADDRGRVPGRGEGRPRGARRGRRGRRRGGARGDPRAHDARGRAQLRRPARDRRAAPPRGARPGVGRRAHRRGDARERQPHVPARAPGPAGRGRRRGVSRHRRGARGGPRRGLRQPPRRQRRGRPRRGRPLGGGPRAAPARDRLEPVGQRRRERAGQPREPRDRGGGGRGGHPAPGPGARRARDRWRRPARRARLPGDRGDGAVERRPRRCPTGRGARLGAAQGLGGLGPHRAHGVDVDGGRVGDRGRGAREAADRRRGGVTRAREPDPRRCRGRGRPGPGGEPGGPQRRARGEPRDGARVPCPPRRP